MDIVIDTSALIAVIVGEPERNDIIELSIGNTLIGPGSIPWEIGNAFSSMFKKNMLNLDEAKKGLAIFNSIPLRFIETNFFGGGTKRIGQSSIDGCPAEAFRETRAADSPGQKQNGSLKMGWRK